MGTAVSIEAAGPELRELLEHLPEGETVDILGHGGERVAMLVSLKPAAGGTMTAEEWLAELDALAEEVRKAWKSEKTAVEIISEMRR